MHILATNSLFVSEYTNSYSIIYRVMHVHSEIAETLDIDALIMDKFIKKNKIQSSTFVLYEIKFIKFFH